MVRCNGWASFWPFSHDWGVNQSAVVDYFFQLSFSQSIITASIRPTTYWFSGAPIKAHSLHFEETGAVRNVARKSRKSALAEVGATSKGLVHADQPVRMWSVAGCDVRDMMSVL